MKFNEMSYQRPDFDKTYEGMKELLARMESAQTETLFFQTWQELEEAATTLETLANLVYIRHTIDTRDEFYQAEQDAFDAALPRFQEINSEVARIALASTFRPRIEEQYGPHLLEKFAVELKTFKPEIVADLVEENRLMSEYQKITAGASILFEGEERNLSGLIPFMESPQRDTRRRANQAHWDWFAANEPELDRLFDELVRVRHGISKKLGHDNFIPVAYARMERTDWTPADARGYRRQIAESVVPLTTKLYREQSERIGIPDMKNYDYTLQFLSGNPTPKGSEAYLVEEAAKMYRALSQETDEFFTLMRSQELMDLTTKPGKANGGYCTDLPGYEVPFIFSNFNGTSGDVDVLTHEAGHAFQSWLTRKVRPRKITVKTSEVAEIHSMSMEFFTHPWMNQFFKEDTEKYYYAHVTEALEFLPYGASIDEFQEWVYENPEATPAQRRAKYRDIEQKFLPHLDYDNHAYLENGGRWQKQLHVFLYPFYYLDYTLAQVCAQQYLLWSLREPEKAWASYLGLCQDSGRLPFKQLVPKHGLLSPFEEGTIAKLIPSLEAYLSSLDHSKIQ